MRKNMSKQPFLQKTSELRMFLQALRAAGAGAIWHNKHQKYGNPLQARLQKPGNPNEGLSANGFYPFVNVF